MLNDIVDIKRRLITPVTEPVTLEQVKEWLIIDHADDDALLTRIIKYVRSAVESKTKLSLVEKDVIVTVRLQSEFKLPYGPIRLINSVVYQPGDNQEILTADNYKIYGEDQKRISVHKCGPMQISYKAGFGVVVNPPYDNPVPDDLINGILQEIAYRYEHRGDEANTRSAAGNESVIANNGISSGAMQYIKPYIGMAWV